MGPFGTFDMAGNMKEWTSNATGDKRYILGAAWDERDRLVDGVDAQIGTVAGNRTILSLIG